MDYQKEFARFTGFIYFASGKQMLQPPNASNTQPNTYRLP